MAGNHRPCLAPGRRQPSFPSLFATLFLLLTLIQQHAFAIFNVPQPGGSPSPAYVANALRNQRELALSVPIDRVNVPGINATSAWFNGDYTLSRIGNLTDLLVFGYRRVYLDIWFDARTGNWQLCPSALPLPPSTATTRSTTTFSSTFRTTRTSLLASVASVLSADASLSVSASSSAALLVETATATASLSSSTALAGRRRAQRQKRQDSSLSLLSSEASRTAFTSTASHSGVLSSSTTTHLGALSTTTSFHVSSTASASPTATPTEIVFEDGTVCSTQYNQLSVLLSELYGYLFLTKIDFYRDLIFLLVTPHVVPTTNNNANNTVPAAAIHSLFTANNLSPFLYTPIDLYVERQNLNLTFGTCPYYVSESTGTGSSTVWDTADGWPTLGFVLDELSKRLLVGFATADIPAGYDPSRDSTWLFSAEALNATVPLDFGNTGQASFSDCAYPAPNVVMVPTGNETGGQVPPMGQGESSLTWSFAFLSSDGMATGANYTAWTNPVACGFSPLYTEPVQQDDLAGSIWSWDVNMPQNGSLANCAVQQKKNGRWAIDSCASTHPVACQSVRNPEIWTVSAASNTYTLAASECPAGYFFSVPRTAKENAALWTAFKNAGSAAGDAIFLDFSSLSHQGCWVSGGPNAFCPYVDRQAIITQIIQTSFQEGIVVLVLFILFVWFQCRNQFKNVQKRKRRTEVKWKMASEEVATIPA